MFASAALGYWLKTPILTVVVVVVQVVGRRNVRIVESDSVQEQEVRVAVASVVAVARTERHLPLVRRGWVRDELTGRGIQICGKGYRTTNVHHLENKMGEGQEF